MKQRSVTKSMSAVVMVMLVMTSLGPGNWQPRTMLGWEVDHLMGYFVITMLVSSAWRRPYIVGPVLIVFALLLEVLQGFTPDRSSDFQAAIYSALGILGATFLADIVFRPRRLYAD